MNEQQIESRQYSIAIQIKNRRKELGIKKKDFAKSLEKSETWVYLVEQGEQKVSADDRKLIEKLLKQKIWNL